LLNQYISYYIPPLSEVSSVEAAITDKAAAAAAAVVAVAVRMDRTAALLWQW
jgi:hypothetical protein